MLIPNISFKLKYALTIWALVAVPWLVVEGNFRLTISLGLLTTLLILYVVVKNYLAGHALSTTKGLLVFGGLGLLLGFGSSIMVLTLMALKTGFHAHGPEFSRFEIGWVIGQIPLWTIAGLLAGVGLAFLFKSAYKN